MWIYIVLYMLLFLTSLCEVSEKMKKYNLFILYSWVFIFTLFRGLRWGTGTDWPQYYACFENAHWDNIFSYYRYGLYTELMEYGYVFLNVLIKTIFGHYSAFLLITNCAILLNYAHFCRTYVPKYPLMTFALVVLFTPIFPVRQDIATIFVLWACYFSIKGRYFFSMLFVFVASTIHDMSILFFPVCLLFNLRIGWAVYAFVGCIGAVVINDTFIMQIMDSLGGLSMGALSEMSTMYLENVNNDPVKISMVKKLYTLFFILLFKYYYNKSYNQTKRIYANKLHLLCGDLISVMKDRSFMCRTLNFYTNGYICYFVILMVASLGGPISGCARLANFFFVAFPFCFMIVFSMENDPKKIKGFICIFILYYLYQFFRFNIFDIYSMYGGIYFPYYSVFEDVPQARIRPW